MIRTFSLVAGALAAAGLLAGSPDGVAQPDPVVATFHHLAPGFYSLDVAAGAVWAVNTDEFHSGRIYRINPKTNHVRLIAALPFPTGGVSVAFDSIWVSDYYGNKVWRLSHNGHVQTRMRVGLQPQWLHAAFGSMWVSNHHGASLSRIDPATDSVLATVAAGAPHTFRSGPQAMADDGTNLYVGSSNLASLQWVDPMTDTPSTATSTTDDQFCGPLVAIHGNEWSSDPCSDGLYRFGPDGTQEQVIPSTGTVRSVTTRQGRVWVGDDTITDPDTGVASDAVLDERNARTGALLRTVAIGGDATDIAGGFGDLWVYDGNANTIRRVEV